MIHVVLGTKAQLIKMAPIMKRLTDLKVPYRFVFTGQHQATIDEILQNFQIKKPDLVLYSGPDITRIPQMLLWSVRILWQSFWRRADIFQNDSHGIVLVHGDTFSTLLGAIMAKVARLKVGHVESGLRSFNWLQPFPEELTRLATFALTDIYFCSSNWAVKNLERYSGQKVNTENNTLYDALTTALPVLANYTEVVVPIEPYGVVTLHRFENFKDMGSTLKIVEAVEEIAKFKPLLFILHKPTEQNLKKHGLFDRLASNPRIELRPRYDYFKFIKLVHAADFVVSDGGSNQEECYYLGKPVLLLRNVTERQEGVGRNCVVSRFDFALIRDFLNRVESYRYPLLEVSQRPSDVIVHHCKPFVS